MTFVSYAQNFEDVLLWRALGHIEAGFYIDVGASHPDTDSVTRAFYDRGWRGINVEPTRAAFERLEAARRRDLNLCVALGEAPGTATFYAVADASSGLSTLDAGAAAQYRALGFAAEETEVEVETLADLCRRHAPADVHFLKIDVEGAERQVLLGADFGATRPWIVLLEATAPMSTEPVHAAWEGLLDAADYRFLWFDGLNRYYAAAERYAALSPSFRAPPNVFDDFLRVGDTEWTRRIEQAESRAQTLQEQLDGMQRRAAAAETQAAVALDRAGVAHLTLAKQGADLAVTRLLAEQRKIEAAGLSEAGEVSRRDIAELRHRSETAEMHLAAARDWLAAMRRSTSWRVTAPLRRLAGARSPAPAVAEAEVSAAVVAVAEPPPAPVAVPALATAVRAVHQFHSGSAAGDAITNAMLLTRSVLRGLGYDSHIFVEHRDPACGDEIHGLDALPGHNRYVLIVRHSMGHDALSRILALPVRKVLIYHNITPPELLTDSPFFQSYARKGRDQLAQLRDGVAAALADSEFNAMELRAAGFEQPAACPLLVDVDAMAGRALARQTSGVFTVLFVGRIARSKGQLELVEAFARFRSLYKGGTRLILVGRHHDGDPYLAALVGLIKQRGLGSGAVEIAGLVSDAGLRQYYAEADLYVSLSQHEGFGVPLVEAMVHGVPVLAWPAGAVSYTLGGAAPLLEDTTPATVAAAMLELAESAAARAAIAGRQSAAIDRFRLPHQVPKLLAALRQAGAAIPPALSTREALAENIQVTIAGHVNGTYSLAEVNRAVALAIDAARPGAVRLLPVESGVTVDISRIPAGQRDAIQRLVVRPPFASFPKVVISQHYPVWVPVEPGDLTLALFFWEESLVPAATIEQLGRGFDAVLAPSRCVAKALVDSGLQVPVRVLGQAPRLEHLAAVRAGRAAGGTVEPFTFLHVSSCFPRKGVDLLLAAYVRAFRGIDAVRLVIKGFPNPHNDVAEQIARIRRSDAGAPAIELIDEDIDEAALLDLYRGAHVMVLPTRGEGYNLPAAEALAAGLPLIVTGHGGHMDFLGEAGPDAVRLVKFRLAPAATHLSPPFSLWAEPDADDLVAALREAFQRGPTLADRPGPAPCLAAGLGDIVAGLLLAPPGRVASVAWVTTWNVRCGIAEYARHLVGHVGIPGIILADKRTAGSDGAAAHAVEPAWQVADPGSLPGLFAAVIRHDPSIVVVQHQPGLLPWSMLAALLRGPALHGRVVCAALHNTRHLLDVPEAERQAAVGALGSISRVVVHTLADLHRLSALGLRGNVTLIPQGTPAVHAVPGQKRDGLVIGCYGFFLPGKGMRELIEALGIIRRQMPDARLRLVNAEYPLPESADEIAFCRGLAGSAGLTDAIEFATAFLHHAESEALLGGCDLIVLPYQESREASSAALRAALVVGVPVLVTPLPLFDEAEDAVVRLPGMAPEEIARGIIAAVEDPGAAQASVAAAQAWMGARGWTAVGPRWAGMLRSLLTSGVTAGGV